MFNYHMNFVKHVAYFILITAWGLLSSCSSNKAIHTEELQIAVIADVHLQDVYGKLKDSDYRGIRNPENGNYALIRTMGSQLRSTRIFNENYFAFLTALDDIVRRKIKYVILPGDFSDDGQAVHIKGLKRILNAYSKSHGISFFLITGNHDVVHPFDHKDGKNDFLGANGKSQPVMSHPDLYVSDPNQEHPLVLTTEIQNLGYLEITDLLGEFGFFPKKEDIYWETPFSNYSYHSYSFKKAKKIASLENRQSLIPPNDFHLPDISYLVEPIKGLWLLAIDANTYFKKEAYNTGKENTATYVNNGIGNDNLIENKKYLSEWIGKIVQEAKKHGKTVIAFSHYPMVDFNNNASSNINNLLVGSKMQLKRNPDENVANIFADAGLKIHLGGHMHINDTGTKTTPKGNTLVNIQVPSLAAYMPAYKLLKINRSKNIEIQTVIIDSVPRFKEFFKLYEQEYEYLQSTKAKNIWNKDILSAKNYHEFTNWHLKELVRLRFLPNEWPSSFIEFFTTLNGKELLILAHGNTTISLGEKVKKIRSDSNASISSNKKTSSKTNLKDQDFEHYKEWSGFDFLFDLYRLRSADHLALKDIGEKRITQYNHIIDSFLEHVPEPPNDDVIRNQILELMQLFKKFLNGEPSDHFQINMKTGEIHSIEE